MVFYSTSPRYANKRRPGLKKDEQGATAVEFGLVALPLLLIIMGTIEFGLIYFALNTIEHATTAASRLGITGSTYDSGLSREELIKEEISSVLGELVDKDEVDISCTDLGETFGSLGGGSANNQGYTCGAPVDNTKSCSTVGGGDSAVLYTVSYCWDFFTPLVGQFFDNNQMVLRSSFVVKNESFN